jgi:(1->4)-alpha-D-glucan 1-alpha-D-glucosylmutase
MLPKPRRAPIALAAEPASSASAKAAGTPGRPPRATYRLQFNAGFTLRQAAELVPYLHDLGISHLYASPLLKAMPGSSHGYDVCDFAQLNPELGTEADFQRLVAALREREMGVVLDIVPNHMGIDGAGNRWWWDVLTHGPASSFAQYFDIDWEPADPRLRGRVLLPVLAERYARALEKGKLGVQFEDGVPTLRYLDRVFPLAPESASVVAAPPARLSPAELDRLLEQQHYRLTFWRHADTDLNYRRFFNIASLAALRTEDETVFTEVHARVRQWLEQGSLDGLRVDHVDGLRDPEQYLRRLRRLAPQSWLLVEKILEPGEALPAAWPVAGTTGYDFLNRVGGLFVDPAGAQPLAEFYTKFTGRSADYPAIVRDKKRLALRQLLAAEINRLVALLLRISARHWRYRDFTAREFRLALTELASAFPTYRTYVQAEANTVTDADAARLREAVQLARQAARLDPGLFDFLADLLLLKLRGPVESDFVMRFQQLTGPVMAKGVEDTACYCFNRLISLNEVGGNPAQFGLSVEEFHAASARAQAHWPESMLATATHDTKHGEDFRARLSVLSELPQAWRAAVTRWSALNERHRSRDLPGRNIEYLFYQTLVGAWPLTLERALAYMEKAACEAKTRTTWTRRNPQYDKALARFVTGALADAPFLAELETFVATLVEPGWINSLAQTLIRLTAPGVPDSYQGAELWDLSLVDPDNRRPVDFGLRRRLLDEVPRLTAETIWRRRDEGLPKLWLMRQALALRRQHPDWFDAHSPYAPLRARGDQAQHVLAFQRSGAITLVPRLLLALPRPRPPIGDPGGPGPAGMTGADWGDTSLALPAGAWQNELTGEPVPGPIARIPELLAHFPVALLSRKESS